MRRMLLSAAGASRWLRCIYRQCPGAVLVDGFGYYTCAAPPVTYYQPYYDRITSRMLRGTPYAAWNRTTTGLSLRPAWLPSYPGPRPGGH